MISAGWRSVRRTERARDQARPRASVLARHRASRLLRGGPSLVVALERAAGLREEDVVERRRVQLQVARPRARRRRARGRPAPSRSAPPRSRTATPLGEAAAGSPKRLEHAAIAARVVRVGGDRLDASSGRSPPSATRGVPSATIRPWSMIPTRSASTSASSRYCVVRKTVTPSSLRQPRDLAPQRAAALRVQAGRRLVEEQDRRAGARARARGPAGASCRPSSRRPCGRPRRSGPTRSSSSSPRGARSAFAQAVQPALELEVLAAGEEVVERRLLERGADPPAHLGALRGDVEARDRRACPPSAAAAS